MIVQVDLDLVLPLGGSVNGSAPKSLCGSVNWGISGRCLSGRGGVTVIGLTSAGAIPERIAPLQPSFHKRVNRWSRSW